MNSVIVDFEKYTELFYDFCSADQDCLNPHHLQTKLWEHSEGCIGYSIDSGSGGWVELFFNTEQDCIWFKMKYL